MMKNLLKTIILTATLATSSFAGGGGDILRGSFVADNFEMQVGNEKGMAWDSFAYLGHDINKVYIYSEGSRVSENASFGSHSNEFSTESENQLVYSLSIAPFWDVQIGGAYDTTQTDNQTWGVIGIQGLAPYFFEVRTVVLVGSDGNIGFRGDAEYEALITQKLILTPSVALSAYSKDNIGMSIGKGFSNLTIGARLRYEFIREFAPYLGVEWSKNFSNTNKIENLNETYATVGLRFWF